MTVSPEGSGASTPGVVVTDGERDQVVATLRSHCGDGTITLDEFADRVGIVFEATTRDQLRKALDGLPLAPARAPIGSPAGAITQTATRPTTSSVIGIMCGGKAKGRWRPAERVNAFAFMGGVSLDLRRAELTGPVIDINATAIMGGVEVIVPEGVPVEVTGLAVMGGKTLKLREVPVRPGLPLVRVHVFAFWGGVVVRHPSRRSRPRVHGAIEDHRQRAQRMADDHLQRAQRMADDAVDRAWRHAERWLGAPAGGLGEAEAEAVRSAAPDGTVTLLFTDIEGFTSLTERLGDLRAQDVLRAHNRVVREQVTAAGGHEIKSLGDSFMLAFAGAGRALRCAIAIQRELARWSADRPDEAVRVRMGIHTGEAIREADDLFGRTVIVASRITDTGCGGEVLVSALTCELTSSSGEFQFGDPRTVELKGISAPQVVRPVVWE
jgi:class 3 adenylate cyclase